MFIYDKRKDSIDVYSFTAKVEELKKYRETVIGSQNREELFYSLTTNSNYINFQIKNGNDSTLQFLKYFDGRIMENGWVKLLPMEDTSACTVQKQKEIIARYIEGEYDDFYIKNLFGSFRKGEIVQESKSLLITEEAVSKRSTQGSTIEIIWETKNIMELPKRLYLLYLLNRGEFSKLIDCDITEQLSLFDINYLRSININDIEDILSTGLLSGTMKDVIKKAETGTKILRKIKK